MRWSRSTRNSVDKKSSKEEKNVEQKKTVVVQVDNVEKEAEPLPRFDNGFINLPRILDKLFKKVLRPTEDGSQLDKLTKNIVEVITKELKCSSTILRLIFRLDIYHHFLNLLQTILSSTEPAKGEQSSDNETNDNKVQTIMMKAIRTNEEINRKLQDACRTQRTDESVDAVLEYLDLPKLLSSPDMIKVDGLCPVCMDDLGGSVVMMTCGHLFHKGCLKEWLKISLDCPVCKIVPDMAIKFDIDYMSKYSFDTANSILSELGGKKLTREQRVDAIELLHRLEKLSAELALKLRVFLAKDTSRSWCLQLPSSEEVEVEVEGIPLEAEFEDDGEDPFLF